MDMKKKININKRYFPKEEIYGKKIGIPHYTPMFKSIISTFDLKNKFVCDIGCREGWLLYLISEFDDTTKICGYDYFEWMKESADDSIKLIYQIWDMRDDIKDSHYGLEFEKKFDLLISTEVGEHIDPYYANIYLQNMLYLMKDEGYLIMSWSETDNDKHNQHLNPLKRYEFFELMEENGFEYDLFKTEEFLMRCGFNEIQEYYIESNLSVWKKIIN